MLHHTCVLVNRCWYDTKILLNSIFRENRSKRYETWLIHVSGLTTEMSSNYTNKQTSCQTNVNVVNFLTVLHSTVEEYNSVYIYIYQIKRLKCQLCYKLIETNLSNELIRRKIWMGCKRKPYELLICELSFWKNSCLIFRETWFCHIF